MNVKNSYRGFTLVELLISMALTVLVGGVLYLLQSTGLSTASRGTTRLTLQSEMRRKMEKLISDLRCANEVINIAPSYIKIARFKEYEEDEDSISDPELITVEYELERKSGKWALFRTERNEQANEIFSADYIEPEIFSPFYETAPTEDGRDGSFEPFDMKSNDSSLRKRISFVRIHIKAKQNREELSLTSAVTIRTTHTRLMQPAWKFR